MNRLDYFKEDNLDGWDGHIYMTNVREGEKDVLDYLELHVALPCGDALIPIGFRWNGASVGPLRRYFPKWKHPIATCRHDIRCELAVTAEERKFADKQFKKDVGHGGTWWEKQKGYYGVRVGAWWAKLRGQLV